MSDNSKTIMDRFVLFDQSEITVRDLRIIDLLLKNPGLCGNDLVTYLRLPSRSSVQGNIPKLIRRGMIEDRRHREGQAIPSRLFVTDKGREFWEAIIQ